MEAIAALERLAALAQETRLALFRKLVQQGPAGLAAYLYDNCCQGGACCPPNSPLAALPGARKGKTQK